VIRFDNIHLSFGGQVIFNGVNWQTKDNDRVGLVGPNGSGKTTLLRMITGEVSADRGKVNVPRNTTIGYMPQELVLLKGNSVFDEVQSVFTKILDVQERTNEIEQHLATEDPGSTYYQTVLQEYGRLQEEYVILEGYTVEAKIGEVLNGLGFHQSDWGRSVEEFSGGWQMRLVLAKLLLSKPTVLLLDEPTNHLDLEARNWLEEYLEDYPGTIILVSHDRFFLDKVTSRITEIEHGSLTDYHSTYSGYKAEKEARYEHLVARAKRQQEEIKRTRTFINKFRYDKRRASLVQSRLKMLERIEIIKVPPQPKKIHFQFPHPPRSGRVVIELQNINKAYGEIEVFRDLDLIIERGDRIGLVGPNGAGKSTLMRILAGIEHCDEGTIKLGHNVNLHFMDQEVTASLNMENLVLHELQDAAPFDIRPKVRNLLGAFLFSGDDVHKKISVLSGGEKSRMAIAKMLLEPSNLLLLDEPTNHLDIFSQEILLNALEEFPGTIVFVSHERYFINELAKKIIEINKGRLTVYPGNYEAYLTKKAGEEPVPGKDRNVQDKSRRKEETLRERERRKTAAREERKRLRQLRDLEEIIHKTESELQELEISLSDPDLYKEGEKAKELVVKHKRLQSELKSLYDLWVESEEDEF
jgi:ATP-binding cassette subfamily F protein 3